MQKYTDIHCHILPGVDDGAKSIEMSMEMLEMAEAEGIGQIILTPHNKPAHHNPSRERLQDMVAGLQEKINQRGMEIKLFLGSELYYRSELLELLDRKEVCTMADSTYVLVEFNPMEDFDYIRKGIYRLMAGGYFPILAHTERYTQICSLFSRVEELVEMGCGIQINAHSVMGEYGYKTKYFTRRMLKHRLVHFLATDAHDNKKRKPCFNECVKYISRKYGEEYVDKLLREHPKKIIANEYI